MRQCPECGIGDADIKSLEASGSKAIKEAASLVLELEAVRTEAETLRKAYSSLREQVKRILEALPPYTTKAHNEQ